MFTRLTVVQNGAPFPSSFDSFPSIHVVRQLTFLQEVTALVQPESVEKIRYVELAGRGVIIKPVKLEASSGILAQTLSGIDIVISCMTILQTQEEFALIEASKAAGVGRYVPSFFGPCSAPRGAVQSVDIVSD